MQGAEKAGRLPFRKLLSVTAGFFAPRISTAHDRPALGYSEFSRMKFRPFGSFGFSFQAVVEKLWIQLGLFQEWVQLIFRQIPCTSVCAVHGGPKHSVGGVREHLKFPVSK